MAPRKPQIHSFKRIQTDLKEDTVKNVILFYGREAYLIRWSVEQIKSKYINPAVEMFDFVKIDGTAAQAGQIIEACETMPMMSERRVVLVEDFDMAAEGSEELGDYFTDFPQSTVLIMICSAPDKRRKLFKSIQKNGAEYDFAPLDLPQLKSFISKRFKAAKKKFNPDICGILAESSGYYDKDSDYTIDNLVNDISKIIAHSEEIITVDDIEDTVSGNQEKDVFAFSDALAAGRKGEALELLGGLLEYGENVFKLLGLICSQFETVLLVNEMKRDGMSTSQMHTQTGIHEFRIKKSMSLASRYSSQRLRSILMKAYEVDRNIKSGLSEPETALELLVAGV